MRTFEKVVLKVAKSNSQFRDSLKREIKQASLRGDVEILVDTVLFDLGANPEKWSDLEFKKAVDDAFFDIKRKNLNGVAIARNILSRTTKFHPNLREDVTFPKKSFVVIGKGIERDLAKIRSKIK